MTENLLSSIKIEIMRRYLAPDLSVAEFCRCPPKLDPLRSEPYMLVYSLSTGLEDFHSVIITGILLGTNFSPDINTLTVLPDYTSGEGQVSFYNLSGKPIDLDLAFYSIIKQSRMEKLLEYFFNSGFALDKTSFFWRQPSRNGIASFRV